MLVGEISNDGDTTDEETNDNNEESDEEEDKPIFESDVEDSLDEGSEEEISNEGSEEEIPDEESEEEVSSEENISENDSIVTSDSDSKGNENESLKKLKNNAENKFKSKTTNKDKSANKNLIFKPPDQVHRKTENEYESDSSDEEDIRNTVGNIPMKWYNDAQHLGYDWDGNKILKPEKGDQLDSFLKRMEDPDFWRTIKDYQTGQDVVLSEADIDLITRIQKQRIPDANFDEYAVSHVN